MTSTPCAAACAISTATSTANCASTRWAAAHHHRRHRPQTAARVIAEVGDPAHFRAAGALAAYVGTIPALKQSGKRKYRAATTPIGNAQLRAALWMPTLTAVRTNPWLRAHYQRLRARGKLPKVALVACMHKLLLAIYSVAKHRRPFVAQLPTAETRHEDAA